LIKVHVDNGTVKLSGFVGSAAERDRAYRLAASVPGARNVETHDLAVRWWAKDEDLRGATSAKPTDREIHDAIKTSALVDPRVKSYNVQPKVSGGLVTLTGEVDNPRAKLAAESLARNTVGVLDVRNEIVVAPAKPIADPTLKDRIISALALNPFTPVGQVKVAVKAGIVTLTGSVDTHFESAQAEDVAAQLRGVRQVRNELEVKRPEKAYVFDTYLEPYAPAVSIWRYVPRTTATADREIQREVVDELTWSPFVDAEQVDVRVFDGTATLTGTVESVAELRAATENAFEGGALRVDNQLKVSGG
jgi:osmotically-inducible protein OsmY